MSTTAKVFMSGRSQALRLPGRLRLSATEVRIEQIGADLWVHPETSAEQNMGCWLQQFYASAEPLPADFLTNRQDGVAQERDWT